MILVVELGETEWFVRDSDTLATEFSSASFRGLIEWLVNRDEWYLVTRDSEEPFETCFQIITGLVYA